MAPLFLALVVLFAQATAFAQKTQVVRIRNLTLVNLTQAPLPDYQQIVQFALSGSAQDESLAAIPQRVRYALQGRGYFRAEVSDPETTVVSQTPAEKVVDLVIRVNPGALYTLSNVEFDGDRAVEIFSADQMRAQFPISPGDVFDTEKIRLGMEHLRKLFADAGYINFTPVPETKVLEQSKSIVLTVDLDVGKRFYFGDLKIDGLSSNSDAAWTLNSDWTSLKGQPYSQTELENFMQQHKRLLPPGFRPERNVEVRQDASSHTLTIELRLF